MKNETPTSMDDKLNSVTFSLDERDTTLTTPYLSEYSNPEDTKVT